MLDMTMNNEYKENFDSIYREYVKKESNNSEKWRSLVQFDVRFVSAFFGLILIWLILMQMQTEDKLIALVPLFIAVGILLCAHVYNHFKWRKQDKADFEKEMNRVDKVLNDIYPGYKDLDLTNKLAYLELFSNEYSKSLSVRLTRLAWRIESLLLGTAGILYGILGNFINWEKTETYVVLLYVVVIIALTRITEYFSKPDNCDVGNFKRVTKKYRGWLLNQLRR